MYVRGKKYIYILNIGLRYLWRVVNQFNGFIFIDSDSNIYFVQTKVILVSTGAKLERPILE